VQCAALLAWPADVWGMVLQLAAAGSGNAAALVIAAGWCGWWSLQHACAAKQASTVAMPARPGFGIVQLQHLMRTIHTTPHNSSIWCTCACTAPQLMVRHHARHRAERGPAGLASSAAAAPPAPGHRPRPDGARGDVSCAERRGGHHGAARVRGALRATRCAAVWPACCEWHLVRMASAAADITLAIAVAMHGLPDVRYLRVL
jgi:hypothetical protein